MISMKENQNQYLFLPSAIQTETTSSLSSLTLSNTPQDQGSMHEEYRLRPQQQQQQQQQEPHDHLSLGGSSNHQTNGQCSAKWMSSKMRLMRKMLGSDLILIHKQGRSQSSHDQVQIKNQAGSSNSINNNSSNEIIRVCSNCKTTKTPLWRGGPEGPKSLCNACGIRQMKARRAMRAAAGLTNCKLQGEGRRSDVDRTVPFKKRFKINVTSASAQKTLPFDEITISLSNKSAFQQTFPQEDKDAAILLMALSCGLIHG